MKLTITDKNQFESVRAAFERRETFTLTGAGITANFLADQLTFSPTGLFGYRPALELTFEQVSEEASSKRWDGHGLPPVGVEFERRFVDQEGSSWARGKVIAHGSRRVFYVDHNGEEWSHAPADMEFRTIRTAEQIADEAKQKAIEEILSIVGPSWENCAEALYDAGYRKP